MYMQDAKLACSASGLAFEQWQTRPVYRVHCHTFSLARQLCGIPVRVGATLVTAMADPDATGISRFRCLPAYRDAAARELRVRVARHLRQARSLSRARTVQA